MMDWLERLAAGHNKGFIAGHFTGKILVWATSDEYGITPHFARSGCGKFTAAIHQTATESAEKIFSSKAE